MSTKTTGVLKTVQKAVKVEIDNFLEQFDQDVLVFPNSFTPEERAYVHQCCLKIGGLKTKSKGKGANRKVTVLKTISNNALLADPSFNIVGKVVQLMTNLLNYYPLTSREKQDLFPDANHDRFGNNEVREINRQFGCLNNVIPQVPVCPQVTEAKTASLPVYGAKNEILSAIKNNPVTLIYGDTGTGKTTQVPQFILNDCHETKQPCRILCLQPRRIAALSVSERVAFERNEKVGHIVGYQIRLESRLSPSTLLTFSTNGILLRTLMGCEERLNTMTHIIIDEVHEREKLCDFLLAVMKCVLPKYPHLKLILMSATLDTDLFYKFFDDCPVIKIPCKSFHVEERYLEDILTMLNYKNKAMLSHKNHSNPVQSSQLTISAPTSQQSKEFDVVGPNERLSEESIRRIEELMYSAWNEGTDESMKIMLQFLLDNNIPVDHQHSETSVTALMIVSFHGNINAVEQLIGLGANAHLRVDSGLSAVQFAERFNHQEVIDFLKAHITTSKIAEHISNENTEANDDLPHVKEYLQTVDEDSFVDCNLILTLVQYIHSNFESGAILVFLPGYADIVYINDQIVNSPTFQKQSNFAVYMLHSSMQSAEQKKVFKKTPPNIRKIILATNIAETSITIDDVVYVIDSGKVKQKNFDSTSNVSSLRPVWISKSSAVQRAGRAGRCCDGQVFRLFSKVRFNYEMDDYQRPEILRTSLHELCLQAKSLAPRNISISKFLSFCPDPPAMSNIRNSIDLLINIDSLKLNEDLTEVGQHLLDLPVDPTLGKMLLYAVVLKCLDPVLTIVCSQVFKSPFYMATDSFHRRRLMQIQKQFAGNTFSDHVVLLRAFQSWQKAQSENNDRSFCRQHYISSASMEMITGLRAQLLGQLRASGFVRAKGSCDIRDLNVNSENWAVVKAALFVGMYPNLIRVDRDNNKLITKFMKKVKLHSSSVLSSNIMSADQNMDSSYNDFVKNCKSDWLMFDQMTRTNYVAYACSATMITPITVALFAGPARLPPEWFFESPFPDSMETEANEPDVNSNLTNFQVDDWISFKLTHANAQLLMHLRQKWQSLFIRRMKNPSKPWTQNDDNILSTLVNVLSAQEHGCGLEQPVGIGQRPKLVHLDYKHCKTPDFEVDSRTKTLAIHSDGAGGDCTSKPRIRQMPSSSACRPPARYFIASAQTQHVYNYIINEFNLSIMSPNARFIYNAVMNGETVYLIWHIWEHQQFCGYGSVILNKASQKPTFSFISRNCLPYRTISHLLCPWTVVQNIKKSQGCQHQVLVSEISYENGFSLLNFWKETSSNNSKPQSIPNAWNSQRQYQQCKAGRQIKGRPSYGQ